MNPADSSHALAKYSKYTKAYLTYLKHVGILIWDIWNNHNLARKCVWNTVLIFAAERLQSIICNITIMEFIC